MHRDHRMAGIRNTPEGQMQKRRQKLPQQKHRSDMDYIRNLRHSPMRRICIHCTASYRLHHRSTPGILRCHYRSRAEKQIHHCRRIPDRIASLCRLCRSYKILSRVKPVKSSMTRSQRGAIASLLFIVEVLPQGPGD